MPADDEDVAWLAEALRSTFPESWDVVVATLDDWYGSEDEPERSHYSWFVGLREAVLAPAVVERDAAMCNRVMAFALPLHATVFGDAVQHRILRYACRPGVREPLDRLLTDDWRAELNRLCTSTNDGQ